MHMNESLKRDTIFSSTWTLGKFLIQKERFSGFVRQNGKFIVYFGGQEISRLKKLRDAKKFVLSLIRIETTEH